MKKITLMGTLALITSTIAHAQYVPRDNPGDRIVYGALTGIVLSIYAAIRNRKKK